jgi:mono/diheme cytochrome c family protein
VSAPLAGAFLLLVALVASACDSSKKPANASTTTVDAGEALESQSLPAVRTWHLPQRAVEGGRLFVLSGCTTCHTYRGIGARNVGASDLTTVGKGHDVRYFERYVGRPSAFGNDVMPPFAALGTTRLRQLALFLAASKGRS